MTMIYLYEKMPEIGIKYLEDALKKVEKDLEKLSDEFDKNSFDELLKARRSNFDEICTLESAIDFQEFQLNSYPQLYQGKAGKKDKEKIENYLKEAKMDHGKKLKDREKIEKKIQNHLSSDSTKWDKEFQKKEDLKTTKSILGKIIKNLSGAPLQETLFDED